MTNLTSTYSRSKKALGEDRNADIFSLIRQGAALSDGELYRQFEEMF